MIPTINCPQCLGQRRTLYVQLHPGRFSEMYAFNLGREGLAHPISDRPAWRLHWGNCRECYGDGCEDDPDRIRIHLQELKERLREKHGAQP